MLDKYGIPGYEIADITDVGNLMGAIQGTDLSGFVGNVYRLFPFPQSVEEFKHKPYGAGRRATVKDLIGHWARRTRVPVTTEPGSLNASPDYVLGMKKLLGKARPLFFRSQI